MLAHSFCAVRWKLWRRCGKVFAAMSLLPKEKLAYVRRHSLCLGQRRNLFQIIAQDNPVQLSTIRPTPELFVPSCVVISLAQPWLVVIVHGVNIENTSLLGVNGSRNNRNYRGQKVSVQVTLSGEVRFDQKCTRMYRGHRCSH